MLRSETVYMSKNLQEKRLKVWPFPLRTFLKEGCHLSTPAADTGWPPSCFLSSLFYLAPHWRDILTKIILARRVLWTTEGKMSSVLTKKLKNGVSMVHIAASLSITMTEQLQAVLCKISIWSALFSFFCHQSATFSYFPWNSIKQKTLQKKNKIK